MARGNFQTAVTDDARLDAFLRDLPGALRLRPLGAPLGDGQARPLTPEEARAVLPAIRDTLVGLMVRMLRERGRA